MGKQGNVIILVLSEFLMSAILWTVFLHLERLCCFFDVVKYSITSSGIMLKKWFCAFSSVLRYSRNPTENKQVGILDFSDDKGHLITKDQGKICCGSDIFLSIYCIGLLHNLFLKTLSYFVFGKTSCFISFMFLFHFSNKTVFQSLKHGRALVFIL